jgi:hypothetical protein
MIGVGAPFAPTTKAGPTRGTTRPFQREEVNQVEATTKTELKALLERLKNTVTALEALIGPDEAPVAEPAAAPEAAPAEAEKTEVHDAV